MVTRLLRSAAAVALVLLFAAIAPAQGDLDWEGHPATFMGKLENGERPGDEYYRLVGVNADIDIAAEEDIWDLGGDLNWDASAVQMYYSSSNGADGMDITIEGLGPLGVAQTATETLNGQTFEATADTWLRIHRVTIVGGAAPAGDVYVHIDPVDGDANGIPDTLQTDTRAQLLAGNYRSYSGFYTCPALMACFVIEPSVGGSVTFNPGLGYMLKRDSVTDPWVRAWQKDTPYSLGYTPATFALKLDALEEIRFVGDALADNSTFYASAFILIYEAD